MTDRINKHDLEMALCNIAVLKYDGNLQAKVEISDVISAYENEVEIWYDNESERLAQLVDYLRDNFHVYLALPFNRRIKSELNLSVADKTVALADLRNANPENLFYNKTEPLNFDELLHLLEKGDN